MLIFREDKSYRVRKGSLKETILLFVAGRNGVTGSEIKQAIDPKSERHTYSVSSSVYKLLSDGAIIQKDGLFYGGKYI